MIRKSALAAAIATVLLATACTAPAGQPIPSVEAFLTALRRLDPLQSVPVTFFAPGWQSPQTGAAALAERP